MKTPLVLSNRGTLFLFCISLLINLNSCTEERGNSNDSPAIEEGGTEPAAFRMRVDSSLAVEPPTAEIGKDSMLFRTPDGEPAPYGIESALILLETKGDRRGTLTHIFKEYGRYERVVDSTMPVQDRGPNFPNHSLAITTPEFTGTYNFLTQYGWQMPMNYSFYLDSAESKTMSLMEYTLKQIEAKKIGDTTINGYQTQVFRTENEVEINTIWMWRGVPIRLHTFLPLDDLEFRLEPVSIEINPDIPDDAFTFPKGVHIQKRNSPPPPGVIPPPMPGPAPSGDTGNSSN